MEDKYLNKSNTFDPGTETIDMAAARAHMRQLARREQDNIEQNQRLAGEQPNCPQPMQCDDRWADWDIIQAADENRGVPHPHHLTHVAKKER